MCLEGVTTMPTLMVVVVCHGHEHVLANMASRGYLSQCVARDRMREEASIGGKTEEIGEEGRMGSVIVVH